MNSSPFIDYAARIEQLLLEHLPAKEAVPSRLHQAMHYSVLNGGKRFRPLLVFTTGIMLNVPLATLDKIAVAIEFIHCYSLVHDDLPAMDDADLRRGKPSCHKAYDEATAILVGDALLTLAFDILCQIKDTPEQTIRLIQALTYASGSQGMIGGQILDLQNWPHPITEADLCLLHELKTGRILEACIAMPMLCCKNLNENEQTQLHQAAKNLGFAFQVQDDLLDFTSTTVQLGKPQGQDIRQEKSTFATIMPLEKAQTLANKLFESVITTLTSLPYDSTDFCFLVKSVAERRH